MCLCVSAWFICTLVQPGEFPGTSPARSMIGAGAMPNSGGENWTFMKSGVMVVVMDSGESRRQRKLHVILAERGTGFVLWKEA